MAASGYTPIITYNSSTTGHNPLTGTGTITTGELAINITDGNLYVGTGSGTYKTLLSLANNSSITISGNVTHAGAYTQTFTATANTSVTLPTSGTIISSVTALSGAVTGTPSSSTYLRGDGTWATVSTSSPGGSNGYVQYNNSGAFGGSANLFWDSTNNRLGIGTSSPSYPLDITADPAASIAIGQSSDDPFVWFDRSDGGSNRLAWRLRESSTRQLIFETGTSTTKYGQTFTQAMTLNNSGNLGLGTTSPNSYAGYSTITLNGSSGGELDFNSSGTNVAQIYASSLSLGIYTITSIPLIFATNNNERFRVGTAGQLGIAGANYGSSGQVLTSQGSGSAPTWTSPSSGAMTLISTLTASSSSSFAFTGLSGYLYYFVIFNFNVANTGSPNLIVQLGSGGGPTYTTSGYNTTGIRVSGGTINATNNVGASGMYLTTQLNAAVQTSGIFYVTGVTSSYVAEINGFSSYYHQSGDYHIAETFGGSANVNLNVTAIKVLTASGNMSSGTISLYGISN